MEGVYAVQDQRVRSMIELEAFGRKVGILGAGGLVRMRNWEAFEFVKRVLVELVAGLKGMEKEMRD